MGLCKVEKGNTYTLKDFKDAQINQLREVSVLSFVICDYSLVADLTIKYEQDFVHT